MPPVDYDQLCAQAPGESSLAVRTRVTAARILQTHRLAHRPLHDPRPRLNAALSPSELTDHAPLTPPTLSLLESAHRHLHLSARAFDRIRRVARTIADLSPSPTILPEHMAEAIQYRRALEGR